MVSILRPEYDLPVEIWSEILDIACLDGGRTVRALSRVSRRFRYISADHRYYSVKIGSTSQLLKFESKVASDTGPGSSKKARIRFLSIVLPTHMIEEAYPTSAFGPQDGEKDDEDYEQLDDGHEEAGSESSLESESLSEEYEYQAIEDEEFQELSEELSDIVNDTLIRGGGPYTISSLSDLENSPSSLERLEFKVYSALRSILETCADTLEVFSLYFIPQSMVRPALIFPPLPRLRTLSVYRLHRNGYQPLRPNIPLLFPVLKVLRCAVDMVWWVEILSSCSSPAANVRVVGGMLLYPDPKKLTDVLAGTYAWETTPDLDGILENHLLLFFAERWWYDDLKGTMNGNTGVPRSP